MIETSETDVANDLQCELAAWELLSEARRERDEAREAMREAWLAMDETDGTDRMINWQNKYAYILEETK